MTMTARVHVRPIGNLGNQMLQYMLLQSMQTRLPALDIDGVAMPDWGLVLPARAAPPAEMLCLAGQHVDLPLLEQLISAGQIRELAFAALGFRVTDLLPVQQYRASFARRSVAVPDEARHGLLINVRGAETLANTHADYGPIPIAFYRQLIEATGLPPVLMGQLADDPYSQALRQAFPKALLMPSQGAMADFEIIRSARHIVASVSTFSWLAAWLSDAQTIHLPVSGIFNPDQREDIDLLPVHDPRYRFYEFPIRQWAGSPAQFEALSAPQHFAPMSTHTVQQRLSDAARRFAPRAARYRLKLRAAAWAQRWLNLSYKVIAR